MTRNLHHRNSSGTILKALRRLHPRHHRVVQRRRPAMKPSVESISPTSKQQAQPLSSNRRKVLYPSNTRRNSFRAPANHVPVIEMASTNPMIFSSSDTLNHPRNFNFSLSLSLASTAKKKERRFPFFSLSIYAEQLQHFPHILSL